MKKRKNSKFQKTTAGTLFLGVAFSFAMLVLMSLIFSFALIGFKNPTGNIGTASLAVFLITAAITGFTVSKYKGDGGIAISALTSLAFVLILMATALISAKGKISGALFMNCLCYMLISSFTAFLGRKRPKRHKR